MSLIIYGASDDLIEVEGDIREEFSTLADDKSYIALSNGALLSVVYDQDGIWRIRVLHHQPGAILNLFPARGEDEGSDEDGCPGYSEKLVTPDDIRWVLYGGQAARHKSAVTA